MKESDKATDSLLESFFSFTSLVRRSTSSSMSASFELLDVFLINSFTLFKRFFDTLFLWEIYQKPAVSSCLLSRISNSSRLPQ